MADWSKQRFWEDTEVGDPVPGVSFPLSVYRLVVEAGANRDFNSIHHNSEFAKASGASEMYANTAFVQGMWERTVREYVGLGGRIRKVGPFRMKMFNTVGETVVTSGGVSRKWRDGDEHFVELMMQSEISTGISVGPGPVIVTLPTR